MNIFQDESGDLGLKLGSSKYFIITLLCPENSKRLGNVVRKFKGRLIKLGWPNTIEIKATHLHMAKHNSDIPSNYKYKNSRIPRYLNSCREWQLYQLKSMRSW